MPSVKISKSLSQRGYRATRIGFYEFGIYPTFFKKRRELAAQEGNYAEVLRLEADAAEMCAAQYQQIPIAYGLKHYEKIRDAYLRYAIRLRELAKQSPITLPPEIDKGKQILGFIGNAEDSFSENSGCDPPHCEIGCASKKNFSRSKRSSRISVISRVRMDRQFL